MDAAQLERRVMLSASPLPWNLVEFDVDGAHGTPSEHGNSSEWFEDAPQPVATHARAAIDQLVFIDQNVEDLDALLTDLSGVRTTAMEVVVLDEHLDGIDQISAILDERVDIEAVHIVSHGNDGRLELGSGWIDGQTIQHRATEIMSWRNSLTEDADLLIYGCDLASNQTGRDLANLLGEVCDCDIAASTDLTGHEALGGNWAFEFIAGDVSTNVVFSEALQASWVQTLDLSVDAVTTIASPEGAASDAIPHVTSGSDRLMLVGISFGQDKENVVTTVIYNGQPLSLIGAQDSAHDDKARAEIWGLVAPDVGSHVVNVAYSGTDHKGAVVGIVTFNGVDQANPLGSFSSNEGNSTTPLATVASAAGELVFGIAAFDDVNDRSMDEGPGQSEHWDLHIDSSNGSGTTQDGSASADVSWTVDTNGRWAVAGVAIQPSDVVNATLSAVADTTIQLSNPTDNFGVSTDLIVDRESTDLQRALVSFDFGSIPAGATLVGATLKLEATAIDGLLNIDVFETLSPWEEGTGDATPDAASWQERLSGTNWGSPGADFDTTAIASLSTDSTGAHAWDVTALVQEWISGTTANNGFLVASQDGGLNREVTYDSREGTNGPQLQLAYTLPPSSENLLLSTSGDVGSPSGVPGLDSWVDGNGLVLHDPNLSLGPGTSNGTMSTFLNLDDLVDDGSADLDAIHYVTSSITVGTANAVNLQFGDILFSTADDELLNGGALTLEREDVGLFRPDAVGDHSSGTFSMLFDDLSVGGTVGPDVKGITLVETTTTLGDTTLNAGDLVYVHLDDFAANDVFLFEVDDVGPGTTTGTHRELIEGDDIGLSFISSFLSGVELIETTTSVGGHVLNAGSLLLQSTGNHANVGSQNISTTPQDIFVLDVVATTLVAGTAEVNSEILLRGADIGFDSSAESIDGISLGISSFNNSPVADAGGAYTISEGDGVTLSGSGSFDDDGDTLSYNWDINNDSVFGDATTVSPTVAWSTLQSFGITDDGIYSIGLRVDDGQGGSDIDLATLTVNNTSPTLTLGGTSTSPQATSYSLSISTSDPGDDTISSLSIDWGDGTIEPVVGNPSVLTHTYAATGTFGITVVVADEDGSHLQSELLVPSFTRDSVFRFEPTTGDFSQEFAVGDGLDSPIDAILGPDGNIYVSGEISADVLRYDATTGAFIDTFIAAGTAGISNADGIAFGPDGNFYVADLGNDRVMRFNASTGAYIDDFVASGSGGIDEPYDITFGPDGNLYVASFTQHSVRRFDGVSGAFIDTFVSAGAGGLDEPEEMVFGPDGNLYVSSRLTNNVLRFDGTTGALLGDFVSPSSGGLVEPTGLAFGADGNLYVASFVNGSVLQYDGTTGSFIDEYVTAGSGGLTDPIFLEFLPQHQVTVINNTAPTDISPDVFSTDEGTDTTTGLSLGTLSTTDPDAPESFSYSVLPGADAALFSVGGVSSDELILTDGILDFETKPSYSVSIRVTDMATNTYDETLTVSVNNLNESPTDISPNGLSVNENVDTSGGISLGTLSTADEDATDTHSYGILPGVDAAAFSIGGIGADELIFDDGLLDFETQSSYSVSVRVTDSALNTYDETLAVTIFDLNDPPTDIAPNGFSINENTDTSAGVSLGTLATSDPDTADVFTYSILPGADAPAFSISGTNADELVLTAGLLDFEMQSAYTANVRVTDSGLNVLDETVTVTVIDLNEAPTTITPTVFALNENTDTTGGISLGTLSAVDEDSGETFSYAVLPGVDAAFFSIGGVNSDELIVDDGVLDFESKSSYTLAVRVTDSGGHTHDEFITLNVVDRNESPISASPATITIPELTDTTGGFDVAVISAVDEDSGETFTYSIQGGADAGSFSIGGSGDVLVISDGILDFESQSSYSVIVRVTDSGLNVHDAVITVGIQDVNEAPSISLLGVVTTTPEDTDTTSSFKLADIVVSDDALGTNLLLLSGADAGAFQIVAGNELHIRSGVAIDFETQSTFNVVVSVDDTTMGTTTEDTSAFALSITNVNETPITTGDTYTATSESLNVASPGVLSNDIDPEGAAMTSTLVSSPSNGTVVLNSDGSFTYIPFSGFFGDDSFSYLATDGALSSVSQVNVSVLLPPPPPEIAPSQTESPSEDETANDSDTPLGSPNTGIDPEDTPSTRQGETTTPRRNPQTNTANEVVIALQPKVPTLKLTTDRGVSQRALRNPQQHEVEWEDALDESASSVQSFAPGFLEAINEVREEVGRDVMFQQIVLGSSLAATSTFSVGYVVWLLRGGMLLSSVLSSLPAWQFVDPLPILGVLNDDEDEADDHSLEALVSQSNETNETKDMEKAE